jgi:hypothetical protein
MKKFLLKLFLLFTGTDALEFCKNVLLKSRYCKENGIKHFPTHQTEIISVFIDAVSFKEDTAIKTGLGVGKTILCALLSVYMCITGKAKSVIVLSPLDMERNNMLSLVSNIIKTNIFIKPFFNSVEENCIECVNCSRIYFCSQFDINDKDISTDNICCIVDEAGGIQSDVCAEYIKNLSYTSGSFMFLTGTPVYNHGLFFDAFHKYKESFSIYYINSEEIDCFEWITKFKKRAIRDFGIDSDYYKVKIKGEFPREKKDKK